MSFADLKQKIEPLFGADQISLVERAYQFAEKAHAGQTRKSGEPYLVHPLFIALKLAELKMDQATIAAALLHDVVEDSGVLLSTIEAEFGSDVAFLVDGVTKLGKLKYRGIERMAESLRKMVLATAEDVRVVLIKLNDRLHNMETLKALPEEKHRRIALETLEIYAPLADRLGLGSLKARLEDLAFPYVYPEEHSWLSRNVRDAFEERSEYLKQLAPEIEKVLREEAVPIIAMDARAKHQYSLWRKLMKFDMDIAKIHDLIALRVIVPTVADCYQALGVIHAHWRPLPGKIKDYIALPKPNGYKSLHTTVFGPDGKIAEIQIRTIAMHEEAEHGIAAHWKYSQTKQTKLYHENVASKADKKEISWVKDLRDWQKDVSDSDEFLQTLKIDFFKNRIFALTPKGDAVDLPEGATALDFAYHVHSQIGNSASGARVNGKMVPLDHEISNFDVVEIITQKNKKPAADWLEFVKTSMARKHITSRLRRDAEQKRFGTKPGGLLVELRVTARDRIGLLNDLTSAIRAFRINIRDHKTETAHRSHPLIILTCAIKSSDELRKLLMKLKSVKGVEEVNYKIL
ncbi:MAG: RelA/SpoT family protein [Candidatus Sungbacteria bacterium]|uniref:RelA/SpoT family protein n=1 Tax=Candidatus Sungiibacteriota bacterium TaxID=2750080 RepID=A0A9D6LU51_9BACT|nr:RelA/SpoT family protein [Candidatus Sungbacteria bacterium]